MAKELERRPVCDEGIFAAIVGSLCNAGGPAREKMLQFGTARKLTVWRAGGAVAARVAPRRDATSSEENEARGGCSASY